MAQDANASGARTLNLVVFIPPVSSYFSMSPVTWLMVTSPLGRTYLTRWSVYLYHMVPSSVLPSDVGKSSLAASFSLLAMNPLESLCSWEFFAASSFIRARSLSRACLLPPEDSLLVFFTSGFESEHPMLSGCGVQKLFEDLQLLGPFEHRERQQQQQRLGSITAGI